MIHLQSDSVEKYDALILGAGPAGCAAAIAMRQSGLRVALIEKLSFPRFMIGESLLPFGNDCLKDLGILDEVRAAGFVKKMGAEFVTGNGAGHIQNWFSKNGCPDYDSALQVERSRFDQILLDAARKNGADIFQPAEASHLDISEQCVGVEITRKEPAVAEKKWLRGGFLVDATGRRAIVGRHLKINCGDMGFCKRMAIYAHFKGVKHPGGDRAGNIVIVRYQSGWFWFIPLNAERVSVGLVTPVEEFMKSGKSPEDFFRKTVAEHLDTRYRMKTAELVGEYQVTSDYTYRFSRAAGPRWLMTGDASGFVDPVFSSGVYLALLSGILAGKTVSTAHRLETVLSPLVQRAYTGRLHCNADRFMPLIRAFYDDSSFEIFMNPVPAAGLARAINRLVSGKLNITFSDQIRYRFFLLLCRLQRYVKIAPKIKWGPS